jgi:hypothetical protein
MESIVFLLGTALWAYAIEIFLVGAFLAFLIQRRKKAFPWFKVLPALILFFAINEIVYLPAIMKSNVTFTIHNQEIANFLEVAKNESLTDYVLSDFFSFWLWFIEACLAFGVSLLLTRGKDNKKINRTE